MRSGLPARLANDGGDRHLLVVSRSFDRMNGGIDDFRCAEGADPNSQAVILADPRLAAERSPRISLGEVTEGDERRVAAPSVLAVRREVEAE